MEQKGGSRSAHRAGSAGEAAARARLEVLFSRIDRLIPDDLAHVGIVEDAHVARDGPRKVAEDAVGRAGLAGLADEARAATRDRLVERWAGGLFRPTWAGALNWGVSTGRALDRAEVLRALEDAALAAVAEGLIDDEVVAALGGDGDVILGMATGGPAEESLAATVHAAAVAPSPLIAAGLVTFLLLLVVPSAFVIGLSAGNAGAMALSVGALVLAGSIAVLVVRRARRAAAGEPREL